MGDEIKGILFGGAKVFNVEKTDVKHDANGKPTFCVWLEGGAYAEYPQQQEKPVVSYYAKDKKTGISCEITQSTFDSNKTTKDGSEYEFVKVEETSPLLFSLKVNERNGEPIYEEKIDGFDGIKFYGSPHQDGVYLSNTNNASVIVDNDAKFDGVNIMLNCKKVKYSIDKDLDSVSRWVGYSKGNGYFGKYKNK